MYLGEDLCCKPCRKASESHKTVVSLYRQFSVAGLPSVSSFAQVLDLLSCVCAASRVSPLSSLFANARRVCWEPGPVHRLPNILEGMLSASEML